MMRVLAHEVAFVTFYIFVNLLGIYENSLKRLHYIIQIHGTFFCTFFGHYIVIYCRSITSMEVVLEVQRV